MPTSLRHNAASQTLGRRSVDGRWLRFTVNPTQEGGAVDIVTDITALKEAEQRMRDAIESLAEGFALFGPDGRLITVNKRYFELTGHDPAASAVTTLREEKTFNAFFRLASPTVIAKLREEFPDLPENPDPRTVFLKLRELRNRW